MSVSLTRQIAALQLVDAGLWDLDRDVLQVLPELETSVRRGVLEGFDHSGSPRYTPSQGKISLRMLLSHTSGKSIRPEQR